jgi:predicted MFS family arabinose efflux permease
MVGLGIVLMISAQRGSYALAGAVAAAYTVSAALLNPLGSRAVDRFGQSRVVRVLVLVHVIGLAALAWLAMADAAAWILVVVAVIAGGSQPATGALVRARWAHLLGTDNKLRTAFAFEGVLDELIFIVGPPLAAFLAVAVSAPAPVIASAMLVAVGSTLLLVQRGTEPPSRPPAPRAERTHPIRHPGVVAVLVVLMAAGGVFGSVDIATVAVADEAGNRAAAGIVLALYALASMASALVLGSRSSTRSPQSLPRLFLIAGLALLIATLPLALQPSLIALGGLVLLAGLAVSPVLISAFSLVETLVPPVQITEGLSWAISAIGLGVAASAAGTGWIIDRSGTGAGFLVTISCATLVAVTAVVGHRGVKRGVQARHGGSSANV